MDGYVQIGTKLDTKDFDAEIKYVESQLNEIEHKLKQADMGFEVGDTQKLEAQYSRLIKQLDRLQKKQADLNRTDLSKVQKSIENIGNSTGKTIKKLGKWALGIFAIESAYGFVRKTISTISQYDEGIAKDIEYINFALASSLKPIIEGLIQLVYKLLTYVNYIAKAWFGINLFANASANAMNKSVKSAGELKKTLAGFDEMNVLNDNGSIGVMGVMPSFDLSKIEGEPPKWLQWILNHKDEIIGAITAITSAFISFKLFGLDPIETSGVFLLIYGLYNLIKNLIKYWEKLDGTIEDNGTTLNDFGDIIKYVGIFVAGLGLLFFGLPVALSGALTSIVGLLMKYWDDIKLWFEQRINEGKTMFNNIWEWIIEQINNNENEVVKGFWRFIGFAYSIFMLIPNIIYGVVKEALDAFGNLFEGIKNIFDGILLLFKGDFKNGFINIAKGIVNILISILNLAIGIIGSVWDSILGSIELVGGLFGQNWNLSGAKLTWRIPYLAKGGIVNQPGRGVMVGSAIAGEAGAEGVIPLTDTQAMETLGATIGKYITINANITNTMNGRVISRELQKINTNNDFAMNR